MTSRHFALLQFRFWQSSNGRWTRACWASRTTSLVANDVYPKLRRGSNNHLAFAARSSDWRAGLPRKLEGELVQAVIHGKEWQTPDTEASALRESCISSPCKLRLHVRH